ncbi:hypothetical protein BCR33DRAFT_102973 [Rhizoclosmatium globosum]|uniref:Uncharacterized protein n=1 Tax=Rhizoclosmatium globosum TaxID=329046 RepID=A0A1Y2AP72_9FUNG|nr:hypothetical protein BCR33DRAFT_102973 [Rhizoclosmatium globosum]|eukprot:ORY24363.1 hypothetical protein BCR33DRAFT_102973 [Rhizoclosmatium globosum]
MNRSNRTTSWSHGNPLYKRMNTLHGKATTPDNGFDYVDVSITIAYKSSTTGRGLTVVGNIFNLAKFFKSKGFIVTENPMLGSKNIGGIDFVARGSCLYKGIMKGQAYPNFKSLFVVHKNSNTGFSGTGPRDWRECSPKLLNTVGSFMDFSNGLDDKDTAFRIEFRCLAKTAGAVAENFKKDLFNFEEKVAYLVFVFPTKTIISYIRIRIKTMITLALILKQFVQRNEDIFGRYHHDVANEFDDECHSLFSKPPSYYSNAFHQATMKRYTRYVFEFGLTCLDAFPALQKLKNPENWDRGDVMDNYPDKLLPFKPGTEFRLDSSMHQ